MFFGTSGRPSPTYGIVHVTCLLIQFVGFGVLDEPPFFAVQPLLFKEDSAYGKQSFWEAVLRCEKVHSNN